MFVVERVRLVSLDLHVGRVFQQSQFVGCNAPAQPGSHGLGRAGGGGGGGAGFDQIPVSRHHSMAILYSACGEWRRLVEMKRKMSLC